MLSKAKNLTRVEGNSIMVYFRYLSGLIFILLLQLIIAASPVQAGGLDGFLKYAGQGGSMTSINKGGVVSDQRSGYMTGGSIIVRGPRPMDLQPLGIQLPHGF